MIHYQHNKKNTGFTLLEVLIALAIFAVIISILFPAYIGTFRNMDAAETDSDTYQMARITLDRMTEDLESAYLSQQFPFTGMDDTINGQDADSLQFMSRTHLAFDARQNQDGNARIAYTIKEGEEESGLILYRSDTLELRASPEEGSGGFILCQGLYAVQMIYEDADGETYDEWDSSSITYKNRLPKKVSILLEFVNQADPESPLRFMTSVFVPMGA
ncbi:MAG: prepilin-type N-terminal cleavage/methylation domain-containing protein [Deltaproteobacteria bacterium]|nr:prepilin-type N-terminal cleavage/methylation domain-containing protein [Deltaproteobacteria bacterium]